MSMIYDRVLTICELDDGGSALRRRLVRGRDYAYGEKEVYGSSFYKALQAGERIDRMAELWRADIRVDQYAVLADGEVYRVVQAQHGKNRDGLDITTLTLRREESEYDFDNP